MYKISDFGLSGLVFGKKNVNEGGKVVNNLVWLHCVMWFVHLGPEINMRLSQKQFLPQMIKLAT